jgi:carboxylate-amine ligase
VQIEFCPSAAPTLGIEMELSLVDVETMALRNGASELLADLSVPHAGEHPTAKHELFESIIEVITGVCDTVADARADLSATLAEVCRAADARGLGVVSVGTHPFSHWSELEVSPDPRYHDLIENMAWPAQRLAICGQHVHVGVPSGAHSIAIVDSLAYHLPLFLALSASSPFWHGLDTGMASARTKIFDGLPRAGLPPKLEGWDDFEGYMATLHNAGVISTIREVWWDVRPHPNFGTVELRMCDAVPTLDEVTAVAAIAQCLVVELTGRLDAGESLPVGREWILRENKWLAARYGLETSFIVDDQGRRRDAAELIDDLVTRLEPVAERLDCAGELASVRDIVERGPSYRRQRRIMADGGSHRDVVGSLIDELRAGWGAT